MKPSTENPDGYEHTSLVAHAKELHGRLLLATYDDNVHPQDSWAFVDEPVNAGIAFDLMAYPMRKHGIEDRSSSGRSGSSRLSAVRPARPARHGHARRAPRRLDLPPSRWYLIRLDRPLVHR